MEVDVVIPVFNQKESLLLTLEGFRRQTGNNKIHVIVVDDGSTEKISDTLGAFPDMNITYIYQENGGRSKARNTAMRYAENDYVIFNDADRIPREDFVENHLRRIQDKETICIGCIKEVYFSNVHEHISALWNIIQSNSRLSREPKHSKNVDYLFDKEGKCNSVLPWLATYSGNMSMRKEVFEKNGGFDENFKTWGFEHFEFGYRLYKSNVKFVRERRAINYHLAHSREKAFYKNAIEESHTYFYNKYPVKEIELLKPYMYGEISLQKFENDIAGKVAWSNFASKEIYLGLTE